MVNRFPRGLIPTPRNELAAAFPYVHQVLELGTPPGAYLAWPVKMSMWGNAVYGDCVTAEEAFAKATASKTFVPRSTVIDWAAKHNFLNGATLTGVMDTMRKSGFPLSGKTYDDGPYQTVDWKNATSLQSAIANYGPVKVGVAAADLETNKHGSVPGYTSGWALYGYPAGLSEDHCMSICGYGQLEDLISLFNFQGVPVSLPVGMPTGLSYAMFTWDSIGIVDNQSMLNLVQEAWVRNPVTVVNT